MWIVKWESKDGKIKGDCVTFCKKKNATDYARSMNMENKDFRHWVEKRKEKDGDKLLSENK